MFDFTDFLQQCLSIIVPSFFLNPTPKCHKPDVEVFNFRVDAGYCQSQVLHSRGAIMGKLMLICAHQSKMDIPLVGQVDRICGGFHNPWISHN